MSPHAKKKVNYRNCSCQSTAHVVALCSNVWKYEFGSTSKTMDHMLAYRTVLKELNTAKLADTGEIPDIRNYVECLTIGCLP